MIMKCLSPVVIRNLGYHLKKVHDPKTTQFITVPCGKCANCLSRKVDDWVIRLSLEMFDSSSTASFVTLTYNEDNLPEDGVSKRDVQLFHKRLRKVIGNDSLYKMRYVIISEYGPNGHRPHYHGIYYNVPEYLFEQCWDKGFVTVSEVLPERLAYVASFHILKNYFVPEGANENFRFSSNFLGLENFLFYEYDNAVRNDWRFLTDQDGNKHVLSRYFRKKCEIVFPSDYIKIVDKIVLNKVDFQNMVSQSKIATDLYIRKKMLNKTM